MANRARKKIARMKLDEVRQEMEQLRQNGHSCSKRYEQLKARKETIQTGA